MLVIRVYGLPNRAFDLTQVVRDLKTAVSEMKGLEQKPESINIFFPLDMYKARRGEEIVVYVEDYFMGPKCTEEVRKELAQLVARVLAEFAKAELKRPNRIEVFVKVLNPDDGYWCVSLS